MVCDHRDTRNVDVDAVSCLQRRRQVVHSKHGQDTGCADAVVEYACGRDMHRGLRILRRGMENRQRDLDGNSVCDVVLFAVRLLWSRPILQDPVSRCRQRVVGSRPVDAARDNVPADRIRGSSNRGGTLVRHVRIRAFSPLCNGGKPRRDLARSRAGPASARQDPADRLVGPPVLGHGDLVGSIVLFARSGATNGSQKRQAGKCDGQRHSARRQPDHGDHRSCRFPEPAGTCGRSGTRSRSPSLQAPASRGSTAVAAGVPLCRRNCSIGERCFDIT